MNSTATAGQRRTRVPGDVPYYVEHPTFSEENAVQDYGGPPEERDFSSSYMPDEITRDSAKRMHYAAYRMAQAASSAQRRRWRQVYLAHRDSIVTGNRKLIFRAVQRWKPPESVAEDMMSDCQIVLIQSVTAYNPWIGVRFSTYAFTCLMRALSRLSQRHAADRFAHSTPLSALADGEPADLGSAEAPMPGLRAFDEYFRADHTLLSAREKMVLVRRFSLDDRVRSGTLEQVGRELGLSKERVRQVQASAIEKLRRVMLVAESREC